MCRFSKNVVHLQRFFSALAKGGDAQTTPLPQRSDVQAPSLQTGSKHLKGIGRFYSIAFHTAGMAKLVDVPDLGSGAARRVGSSPSIRTINCLAQVRSPRRFAFVATLPFPS